MPEYVVRFETSKLNTMLLPHELLVGGVGLTASFIRGAGFQGDTRQIACGIALALFGLGMLLTAIFRKGNQVPFDY